MGSSESKSSESSHLSKEKNWNPQSWNAGSEEVQRRCQNYSFDSIGIWATPIRAKTGGIVGEIFRNISQKLRHNNRFNYEYLLC